MGVYSRLIPRGISVVLAVSLIAFAFGSSASFADEKKTPDRCAYAFAAAGYRIGMFVSAQTNLLDARDRIQPAYQSTKLARELQCSIEDLTDIIDCAVNLVTQNGGKEPDPNGILRCVEDVTDREFPKISE